MISALQACMSLIKRELQLVIRAPQECLNPVLFFLMVVSLFPLAITPATKTLAMLAPGIIWVAALLAMLLSLDRLFRNDFEDGSLEQLILTHHPFTLLVSAKVCSHWLLSGLPLLLISPLLGMMLGLAWHDIVALFLSLLLGTPILSFIGAIGSALTIGLRSSGVLLTLLILPLCTPVLIFGTAAIMSAQHGLPYTGFLALLAAMLILTLTLSPFAIAAAVKLER